MFTYSKASKITDSILAALQIFNGDWKSIIQVILLTPEIIFL
jgi:hypothetical protein